MIYLVTTIPFDRYISRFDRPVVKDFPFCLSSLAWTTGLQIKHYNKTFTTY